MEPTGIKFPVMIRPYRVCAEHGGTRHPDILRDGKKVDTTITPTIPESSPEDVQKPTMGLILKDDDGLQYDGMGIPDHSYPSPWNKSDPA